jgi:proline iminopeptidase
MTLQRPARHSVNVGDAEIAYTVEGDGQPLLVVGSSIYYPRTFSQELKQSCLLVCADLPHFVPLPDEFDYTSVSFDSYARCIESVRLDANLNRVAIAGHSHHGNIALEYAKRFPQNVTHVVMIGSPPVSVSETVKEAEDQWSLRAPEARKGILKERRKSSCKFAPPETLSPPGAYINQYITDAPLYWDDPNYDATWLWEGMTFDMEAIRAFRDLFRDYEMSWDANSLHAPVLIVMGENDYAVPPSLWTRVLPTLSNISYRVLHNCGHTPQLEKPDEFDTVLLKWLSSYSQCCSELILRGSGRSKRLF